MSFGALVIGLGRIGMGYDLSSAADGRIVESHARAFALHPDFRLIGGVDPDVVRRETFEQAYGAPAYATVEEALSAARPDVAVIASPTAQHHTVSASLMAARPHAIVCEKPLADVRAHAVEVVEAAGAAGVSLFVNYPRRSLPVVAEVRRRLRRGEIEPPVKAVAWYSKGILHTGSHLMNLMGHWLGPLRGRPTIIRRGPDVSGADAAPDLLLEFELGAVTCLAASDDAFPYFTVEMLAVNGVLRWENSAPEMEWTAAVNANGSRSLRSTPEALATDIERYQWHVCCELSSALAGRPAELTTGAEALAELDPLYDLLENR